MVSALKHAFPRHHKGQILVDYLSDGDDWTLLVSDNGVGMPATPTIKPGLGTSIVEALANRLGAEIHTADANPGTGISIMHRTAAIAAAS